VSGEIGIKKELHSFAFVLYKKCIEIKI